MLGTLRPTASRDRLAAGCRKAKKARIKRRTGVAAALFASAFTAATPSFCQTPSPDSDAWFGHDKALHFGASFAIAATGYGIGVASTDERWTGVLLGGGMALGLGAGKEVFDAAGLGTPSWRDFTWDCVGAVLGLGVSFAFDAALRGPG